MGQQASNPCVTRQKRDSTSDRQQLDICMQRAAGLIAHPDKLEGECDFHFNRAGLDANGDMRRVELRRLLWTFAHGLGSTELTWEAIEDAAVLGTVEPHVPVVTRAEFFRCVLKTVHLVVAELERKIDDYDAFMQYQLEQMKAAQAMQTAQIPDDGKPVNPWAAIKEHHDVHGGASSASSSSCASSSCGEPEGGHQEEHLNVAEVARPDGEHAEKPGISKGGGKGKQGKAGKYATRSHEDHVPQQQSVSCEMFAPAPGGNAGDCALVNGMTAMLLNCEGAFEPMRLFVDRGILVLSDPDKVEPSITQTFMCADGRSAFDLALLEALICGEAVARTPAAALLPDFAIRGRDADDLKRLLVLIFDEDEVLCLWFAAPEDCQLFRYAILEEAPETPTIGHDER